MGNTTLSRLVGKPLCRRVAGPWLVVALALPSGFAPVHAAAAPTVTGSREAQIAEAKHLYETGKAKYDTFDYNGAATDWSQAYAKLPADAAGERNAMVYNIASAQEKAYELDKDAQHLRQAVLLLESYIRNYKSMYKRTPKTKAEVDRAQARIAALNQRIAAIENGSAPPPQPAVANPQPSGPVGVVFSSGHAPPTDPAQAAQERRALRRHRVTRNLVISGAVLTPVGALISLLSIPSLRDSNDSDLTEEDQEDALNTGLGILTFGILTFGAGAALLGVGLSRRAKARAQAEGGGPQVSVLPYGNQHGGGAVMTLRF